MKRRSAFLLFLGIFVLAQSQGNSDNEPSVSSTVGLNTGEKAPAFTARDQFGRGQSNETLKGAKGTVLLFFRSADW